MSSSPKAEEVNDEPAAVANSSLSAENTLDDQPDEQQDYVDLIDSVEKDPQACSGTTSEADPDPNTEKPAARRTPLTGVGRLLRHARVALFWLQGLGETVDESDVAGVVCQWLGKLDNPGDSVSLDESIALDSLREVLRQVAARQGRECVRCGEVFEEEFNAWTCKKFLDNHYNGKGRLEVYPLAPCWIHDAERAERLMGMDFSLLNRELADTIPDGFRWNCCGKNALALGCGMLRHVSS